MKKFILTLILLLTFTPAAIAGGGGEIKGRVTENGQPAPGAQVIIVSENMQTQTQTTDSDGYYSFENLDFGRYVMTVKYDGKFYLHYFLRQ